tara:strand:+ start:145 stop:282 length:138 start_codon:yes stop_codon:yes gene_type:complete
MMVARMIGADGYLGIADNLLRLLERKVDVGDNVGRIKELTDHLEQ